ncbi:hypothetical protein GCM10028805_56700 [Spirosoma harenae]
MAQLIAKIGAVTENNDWLNKHWKRSVKRIFYIYDVPEHTSRGYHRHTLCTMGLICLNGSVDIYSQTPEEDQYFRLDSPDQLLILEPTDWRIMHNFSSNAILMIVADRAFSETTYIDESYRDWVGKWQAAAEQTA